jgi:hypothetical protein
MLRGGLGQLSGEEILLMALKTGDTSRLATSQIRRPSDLYRENNGNSKFVDYRTASLLLHWPYYSSQKESSASRGLAATSLRAQGNISRPTKAHPRRPYAWWTISRFLALPCLSLIVSIFSRASSIDSGDTHSQRVIGRPTYFTKYCVFPIRIRMSRTSSTSWEAVRVAAVAGYDLSWSCW